jgi:hypothetical protein
MKQTTCRRRAIATLLPLALAAAMLARAASASSLPLELTVTKWSFTSFACDPANPLHCEGTATGEVHSNLSQTPGTVYWTLGIDFTPAPCVDIDETAVFTFDTGTITTASTHRNCQATIRPGPWADATFTITGGTGTFAGATGGGNEHNSIGNNSAYVYNGTINT